MKRDEIGWKLSKKELGRPVNLLFILGGAMAFGMMWFCALILPNFVPDEYMPYVVLGGLQFILLCFTAGILVGTLFYCYHRATISLIYKDEEDFKCFIISKGLEHEFKEYLIKNNLAYDEEKASWRSEFPELKIPFERRIKTYQEKEA